MSSVRADLCRWAEIGAAQKRRCGWAWPRQPRAIVAASWVFNNPQRLALCQNRLGTGDHAIPSFSFGLEHSLVGHRKKLPLIASILRKSGQAGPASPLPL